MIRILALLLLLTVPVFGQGAGSVGVVTNTAALTNRPPSALNPVVFLAGRTNLGDFGTTVYWDRSATNTHDGIRTFNVQGGVGRWKAFTVVADTLEGFNGTYFRNRTNHFGTQNWTSIHSTPTTLAGYGITDPVWTSTNDGPGSGMDADLLDGQHGTFYLDRSNHTGVQAISTVTGLQIVLDGKSPTNHTHVIADVASLQGSLDSKASTNHTHHATNVVAGQFDPGRLGDGTADTDAFLAGGGGGNQTWRQVLTNDVGGLSDWMATKSDTNHTHVAGDVTGGVFAPARLGTGTATAGFVLFGNGSGDPYWGSPPSGTAGTNGIPDADSDGKFYGRRNTSWVTPDISDVFGMTLFGSNFVKLASTAYEARERLELVGVSIATIDSPAKYNVRVNSTGVGTPRHRLNLIGGTGMSVSLSDDGVNDESDVTVRLADRDWGDITSSSSGTVFDIDADAVGAAEIAANSVGNSEMADNAVGAAEIVDGSVGSAELADGGVSTADIGDGQVTLSKIANVSQNRLLGRWDTGGSGQPQEVTLGSGVSLSAAGVLSATAPSGSLAGWAKFTTTGPSPYGITSVSYDGVLVNGVVFNSGDDDESMDVSFSFASTLSNYFVQVEIEASGYTSGEGGFYHPQWWIQGGTKLSTGFDIESCGTSPPAMGYGHTWTVWIFRR